MISSAAQRFKALLRQPIGGLALSHFSSASAKGPGQPNSSKHGFNYTTKRTFAAPTPEEGSLHFSSTNKFHHSFKVDDDKQHVTPPSTKGDGIHPREFIRYDETEADLLSRSDDFNQWTMHIPNRSSLLSKLQTMRSDGPQNTMIITDFDQTISSYRVPDSMVGPRSERRLRVKGETSSSVEELPLMTEATIRVMLECARVTQEDIDDTKRLYTKYRPIEIDPDMSVAEKYKHLYEWLYENLTLFASLKPTDSDLRAMVSTSRMACRYGIVEMLEQVKTNDIPLIVVSGGVKEVIEVIFYEIIRDKLIKDDTTYDFQEYEKIKELYNLVVISNSFYFENTHNEETGRMERTITDFDKNILTSMNKFEFVNETNKDLLAPMQRKNIIIIGDQLHDLQLIDPTDYETVLSIGYLNDLKRQDIGPFLDNFDVVICQDGPLTPFNAIMDMICMNHTAVDLEKYSRFSQMQELLDIIKSGN